MIRVRGVLPLSVTMLFIGFLALIAACSKSNSGGTAAAINSAWSGIYEVTEKYQNNVSCDNKGNAATIADNAKYFVLKLRTADAYNPASFYMVGCSSLEDCQDFAAKIAAKESFGSSFINVFTSGDDANGYSGVQTSTGFSSGEQCTEASLSELSLIKVDTVTPGGTQAAAEDLYLVMTERQKLADPFPKDSDGYCTTTATKSAVAAKSCSKFTSLVGKLIQAL